MDVLTDEIRKLLSAPSICHVATLRRDGAVHAVPAWVDVDDELVLLNSVDGRQWLANLRRDPRVTLTILDREDPEVYASIRGEVVHEVMGPEAEEHIDRLASKYYGVETFPYRGPDDRRVKLSVRPLSAHFFG